MQVRAGIEGTVSAVAINGDQATVTVSGTEGSERHELPSANLLLHEGAMVYPGDALGSYEEGRAGILVEGLWLTLKVSLLAIIAGILLGLFTGLARIFGKSGAALGSYRLH